MLDVSLAFGLEAPTNLVQIVMGPGKLLRGVVRDVAGNPLIGVFVRTDMNFRQQIQTQFEFRTRTDDAGRFEWDSAPEAPASYWFAAEGFESVRDLELIADSSEHVITLKRRGE